MAFDIRSMLLETPRLTLSSIGPLDRDFFFALQLDPSVMAFVADSRTAAMIEDKFQQACLPWDKTAPQWLSLVVREKASNSPIGLHGFHSNWAHRQAELGFLFAPAFQGKGYAKEATQAIIALAKEQGFHKLTAVVTSGNAASAKLLEKCGFEREGVLKEHFLLRGKWHDDWHYGLLLGQ